MLVVVKLAVATANERDARASFPLYPSSFIFPLHVVVMTTTRSIITNDNIAQLRAKWESLQEINLSLVDETATTAPTSETSPTSTTEVQVIDDTIIQRYEEARDRYLTYRMGHTFYDKLIHKFSNEASVLGDDSMDDNDDDDDIDDPEQRRQAAKERMDQFRNHVMEGLQGVEQKRLQLQRDYATFCERREKLGEMIQELEQQQQANDDGAAADEEMEDGDLEDVTDEELALEEEHIQALTKQKEELQAQLQAIQGETKQYQEEALKSQSQLRELLRQRGVNTDNDDDCGDAMMVDDKNVVLDEQKLLQHVAAIDAENQELQRQLQQTKETISWNDDMVAAMEHFGGIKMLSVLEVDNNENRPKDMVMTLEIQQDRVYIMQVTLRAQPDNRKIYSIFQAEFVTKDEPPTLTIPNLDDLVQYARTNQSIEVKEQLKFVVREARMQIRVAEARATELAILYTEFPQVDEPWTPRTSQPSIMDAWEVVRCRVHGPIVATLYMSPDCPLVKESVFLAELCCLAMGADNNHKNEEEESNNEMDVENNIKQTVNFRDFKSPVPLMQAVRDELVAMHIIPAAMP